MKSLITVIFILFFVYGTTRSQSCLPEGIEFKTQDQMSNFQTNHPGCTEIEGNVLIAGDDITNLSELSVVTSIGGNLWISDNATLTSLMGLENLTSVGSYLYIDNNPALPSLVGLDNLISIGGDLLIGNVSTLTSLTGLENVTSIGADLWIIANAALTSLTGLDNVTSIGGGLNIDANDALASLSGLGNVTSIGGYLWITDNDALTSLLGLDYIEAESISGLRIYSNNSLSICEVKSVCEYLISPNGELNINDNATGCDNQTQVMAACELSVENINPEDMISVFPNPANRQVSISLKDGTIRKVNIFNQMGQHVIHKKPENNIIDVSHLQPGMYIIEVVSGQRKIREKLMVK